jgi:arylsulfatase A-like enzyme
MKHSEKAALGVLLLASCMSPQAKKEVKEKQHKQPNIIWIYADDHDQRAISAYGSELINTPNIDRIANEGMVFQNSFVTNSICAPCRAVILTGKHSHLNGVSDNKTHFDGRQQTFPKLLQKAGYETALVGKWHLHTYPTGFDYWNMLPGHGNYYDPRFIENGDTIETEGYITDVTTDFALSYLQEKRNKQKPFCLMLHNKAPHGPWMPKPEHLALFKNDSLPVPDNFFADCSLRGIPACEQMIEIYDNFMRKKTLPKMYLKEDGEIQTDKWLIWLYSLLDEQEQNMFDKAYLDGNREFIKKDLTKKEEALWLYQRYIKDYLRCVASIDENVGRLLDYLDESGLSENTVVFYSSDQGFYLGDYGWYDKRFMYEISMRTPLIARWPGAIKPGSACTEMVQNLDMAETFLDIAGVSIPGEMQGFSLKPLMTGAKKTLNRDALYYHYNDFPHFHNVYPHYGIRTATEKLIHFYTIDEWEYYNLEEAPDETINTYNNTENKDNISELKKRLKQLQKMYRDTSAMNI